MIKYLCYNPVIGFGYVKKCVLDCFSVLWFANAKLISSKSISGIIQCTTLTDSDSFIKVTNLPESFTSITSFPKVKGDTTHCQEVPYKMAQSRMSYKYVLAYVICH